MAVALLAAVLMAGLHWSAGRGGAPVRQLSPKDARQVSLFESDLSATMALDDRVSGPTYGDFVQSVNRVIAVARSNPDGVFSNGRHRTQTLRRALLDAALKLTSYEPDLSARLIAAVETPERS